ncbi:MAG: hypothetical protein EHM58_12640 [Ignavibacteriae bacterium]|nr:MAG: hypothetical protein EHM58_12640 [Ignavibacteriota bacterium]
MKILTLITILALVFIYSCKDADIVGPGSNNNGYNKVLTGEANGVRFELYDSTYNELVTGYNNLGIKVFVNNEEKTSGFAKLKVFMYHTFITSTHSCPISPVFYYDPDKKMFTGYANMLMYTDSTSYFMAFFNYNDEMNVDSVRFDVSIDTMNQTRGFIDFPTGDLYIFTVISPKYPVMGMNDIRYLFHKTPDDIEYYEVDSAQMFLRTLIESSGHTSTGNVNPVSLGNGLYSGKVNLDESGMWFVYDSVKYQDRVLTPNVPPKFIFNVQ